MREMMLPVQTANTITLDIKHTHDPISHQLSLEIAATSPDLLLHVLQSSLQGARLKLQMWIMTRQQHLCSGKNGRKFYGREMNFAETELL